MFLLMSTLALKAELGWDGDACCQSTAVLRS